MRYALIGAIAAALAVGASCTSPPTPAPSATADIAPKPMAPPPALAGPQMLNVMLAPGNDQQSGRLLVFATPVADIRLPPGSTAPRSLSPPDDGWIAAQEAPIVTPAESVHFDADVVSWPSPLSRIKPGEYWVQVRLDTNHNAAYGQIADRRDFASIPVKMTLPSAAPINITLQSDKDVAFAGAPPPPASAAENTCGDKSFPAPSGVPELDTHLKHIDFVSPSLSEFWGRPTHICGLLLLPPDYETSTDRYPAVYRAEGFGASLGTLTGPARQHYTMMKSGDTPPMIRVYLDHSSPWGTHEFADSVNNGPWGTALTEELIPALEKQYRMDGKPSGRFTTGHSSGGWFAIWQQVRYPDVYGGTWARAPDPVDFHSFTGIDIYRDRADAYVRPDGSSQYLVRDASGREIQSFKDYALQENVLGDFGGQIDSFDWVFSPKGIDGRPQPLFDRATGKVDPQVAKYWRDHYDITNIIHRDWTGLKPVLDGKIHLIIGDVDTFHLNEAAHLLQGELDKLGARSSFTFVPGGTHFNLDKIGDDPQGLEKKIAWEMWAVARPNSPLKPKPYVPPPRPVAPPQPSQQ